MNQNKKLIVRQTLMERSRVKSHKDLLTDEEIIKLLTACEDSRTQVEVKRNRAIISVLYESGCRVGEISVLKNEDLEHTDYGFRIWVEGKTGRRSVPLIDSAKYLLEWANVHPRGKEPESPLFVSLSNRNYGGVLKSSGINQLISRLTRKAGIKKHVYPHLFRHTRATELSGLTSDAYLRKMEGWSKTSPMIAVYQHLSGRETEKEYLRIHGIIPEEKFKQVLEARICPKCEKENSPDKTFCIDCGSPLRTTQQAIQVLSQLDASYQTIKRMGEMEKRLNQLEFRIAGKQYGALTLSDTPIDRGQASFMLEALEANPETQQFMIKDLKKQLGR